MKFIPKKLFFPSLLIIAAASVGLFFIFKKTDSKIPLSPQAFYNYAEKIVAKCASASYRPKCYEEEVPKLMADISMEDAFQVTRSIQDQDKSYAYCHVLGHELSAIEAAKDPDNWKDVVARCPSGVCSNGCIHGAFQERFRTETLADDQIELLKPEIKDVCEPRENWNPTGLEQGTCYHALGHLLMYITSADIKKSLALCDELSVNRNGYDWSKLCYDGAYMQIFQPLEPEDFALIEGKQPKKEELASFCKDFSPEKISSCWIEGWPLYFDEVTKPEGLINFCSKYFLKQPADQDRCYMGLFYVLTAQFQFDLNRVDDFCSKLPKERMGQCYANAASRMIETDYRNIPTVIEFCSNTPASHAKEACFDELIKYSTYNFHAGSPEFFQLCNNLPEPWRDRCLKGSSFK